MCSLAVRTKFDAIVSNPPYIAAHDAHLTALKYEPVTASFQGSQVWMILNKSSRQLDAHLLKTDGWLLLEHGATQGESVRSLFLAAGFFDAETMQDFSGNERMTAGRNVYVILSC